jgi:hypothetical protein
MPSALCMEEQLIDVTSPVILQSLCIEAVVDEASSFFLFFRILHTQR